jgi:sterol desaturase/sphingolipid hydroxylase (fatty acid hydroxylase superfamily)
MKASIEHYLAFSAWMLGLTLLFCLFERLLPATAISTVRDRLPNCIYLALVLPLILFLNFIFEPVATAIATANGGWLATHIGLPSASVPGTIAFALAYAIVWDFCQYALHRLQHASPSLWETHRLHHSDAAMNATTQGRHHLLSHVLTIVWHLPFVFLFGSLNPHAVAGVLLFRCWGFVNHANVRLSFGPLTGVIAGPQWHRIHHSIEARHRDRNFATFFPFIDKLFGTYYAPAVDEYPATGLREADRESFARQATYAPVANWCAQLLGSIRGAEAATSRPAENAAD